MSTLEKVKDQLPDRYLIHETWDMNGFQIAKITNKDDKGKEVLYATFINHKFLDQFGYTFDHALLICLENKYEGSNSTFSVYAAKMLSMSTEPEYLVEEVEDIEPALNQVKRLRRYRMDAGYTIYTLAKELGVNHSSISFWEVGKKFPRKSKMEALEDLFGVGHRELFTDLTPEEVKELEQRRYNNLTK